MTARDRVAVVLFFTTLRYLLFHGALYTLEPPTVIPQLILVCLNNPYRAVENPPNRPQIDRLLLRQEGSCLTQPFKRVTVVFPRVPLCLAPVGLNRI